CDPVHFDVLGIPHTMVVWGEGSNHDPALLAKDVTKCVEANAESFGGALPYDHYTFIVHISDKGRGGLEHLNSTVLLWGPDFRKGQAGEEWQDGQIEDDRYLGFMRLVAHEHFHVWNVKRIRPAVLGPFDYQQENYTRDLWTVEGVTSYFEVVGVRRAGMIDGRRFLDIYAKNAMQLSRVPGRLLHSLEDASLNAWVKLYRPNEHTLNSSVSYYLKGEVVCFLLDAHIRVQTQGTRSLDDVLRLLWNHFEQTGEGYPEGSYGDWVLRATDVDVTDFMEHHVRSAEPLEYTQLHAIGLELHTSHSSELPKALLGINYNIIEGRAVVDYATTAGPAHAAGLYAGDELVAFDGRKLHATSLDKLLRLQTPGDTITVHAFRRGHLIERDVTLGEAPADIWRFVPREDITQAQRDLLKSWIGEDFRVHS
ncbi:MAG: PDZ domain-containing protein, partial [Myxococcota bacterium]